MIAVHWFLILLLSSCSSQTKAEMSETEITHALENLILGDNKVENVKNVPVKLNGSPLEITLAVEVIDIRNIDEITNTFVVDMQLFFTWYDSHYIYGETSF